MQPATHAIFLCAYYDVHRMLREEADSQMKRVQCRCQAAGAKISSPRVRVVPAHRLPEFARVPIGIHNPRELAVLERCGSADDLHTARTQLRQHFDEVGLWQ